MKNPLFDTNIADPAITPDPFSAHPMKESKTVEELRAEVNKEQEEDLQTFVQYY